MRTQSIFFVGPLPPPVHGFSEINRRMLTVLQSCANVKVFDLAPRGTRFHLLKLWIQFVDTAFRDRACALYLPLSGGLRQFLDACFATVALIFGLRVFVHHHSFAYLNHQPFYARIVLRLLKNSIHIALCDRMGEMLINQYSISSSNIRVISNAAFLSEIGKPADKEQCNDNLVLGFLSNITAEKGCFDFIDLLKAAKSHGYAVEGMMAGPVQVEIKYAFDEAVRDAGCITHVGPVYGEEKNNFLSQVDVLVFPTRYANEAEPVTIWESMQAGVPVISLSRGCINGMVTNEVGWVIQDPESFVESGLENIRYLLLNESALQVMKMAARAKFVNSKLLYTTNLDALVAEIQGGLK